MQLSALTSFRTLTSQIGIGFLETLKNPANSFKNNLNKTRNNKKSQIQKKKKRENGGIVALLIQYQYFSKKASHEGTKTFFAIKLWGGCSKLEN